ncbi:MAG: ribose-phosphate pyrophosphokinase [Pseudomonadota bacterium]|nr:ribose-phosphate pyrophosphokinase [Pseudomonadota bacterium]
MAPLPVKLFALQESAELAATVAGALKTPLSAVEERAFEDGEGKLRSLENVRGCATVILQTLDGEPNCSVHDKLCRLLFLIGALRQAGASGVTVMAPYLCYARKDRQTQPRDPVTIQYVARMMEAVGCDRVVTLDVHNLAAFQNAFRCRTDHLDAQGLFARELLQQVGAADLAVVSPDVGGVKRVERFRRRLAEESGRPVTDAFVRKHREGGVVSGEGLIGEVASRQAVILDDLISSGTTIVRAARACKAAGATVVHAVATHGLFAHHAREMLADPAIDRLVVTNSVRPWRLVGSAVEDKLTVLDIAPLLAEAIRRIHSGDSLVELLADGTT